MKDLVFNGIVLLTKFGLLSFIIPRLILLIYEYISISNFNKFSITNIKKLTFKKLLSKKPLKKLKIEFLHSLVFLICVIYYFIYLKSTNFKYDFSYNFLKDSSNLGILQYSTFYILGKYGYTIMTILAYYTEKIWNILMIILSIVIPINFIKSSLILLLRYRLIKSRYKKLNR